MKKAICLLGLILVFTSCSSDDTPQEELPNDNILVKRMITTYEDGEELTDNYSYDGNRLLNIKDGDSEIVQEFTYENNLLTRIDYYYYDDIAYTTLSYDTTNNSIEITDVYDPSFPGEKYKIIYNPDNTITVENYTNNILESTDLMTLDTNGNIVEYTNDTFDLVNTFTYDTKNNAFKNIEHQEILHLLSSLTENAITSHSGYQNNLTSWIETHQGTDYSDTWSYSYNESNYPKNSVYYYEGTEDATIQYFYE